jgi:hypothetical protein
MWTLKKAGNRRSRTLAGFARISNSSDLAIL